jgi:hypothetical protein
VPGFSIGASFLAASSLPVTITLSIHFLAIPVQTALVPGSAKVGDALAGVGSRLTNHLTAALRIRRR